MLLFHLFIMMRVTDFGFGDRNGVFFGGDEIQE